MRRGGPTRDIHRAGPLRQVRAGLRQLTNDGTGIKGAGSYAESEKKAIKSSQICRYVRENLQLNNEVTLQRSYHTHKWLYGKWS